MAGESAVRTALAELRAAYSDEHGVELVEIAEGWQFLTRREYAETIERAPFALRPRRLSPAALETLAIIAYRQPVGRLEVDEIRGVDSGAVIEKLGERGLVERSEEHTSELQSQSNLVCRLLLEKKKILRPRYCRGRQVILIG